MINPFTLYGKVKSIQESVMEPLYGDSSEFAAVDFATLLKVTGKRIEEHEAFIHEVCNSTFIAAVFKVIKVLGGAPQLTAEDFDRFTNYVKDGGLEAMFRMLEADNKFSVFRKELLILPQRVRSNAELMLTKAKVLHEEFVTTYLQKRYKTLMWPPQDAYNRMQETDAFIGKLIELSRR